MMARLSSAAQRRSPHLPGECGSLFNPEGRAGWPSTAHEGVGAAPVSGRYPLSGSSPASSSGVLMGGVTQQTKQAAGVLNSPAA